MTWEAVRGVVVDDTPFVYVMIDGIWWDAEQVYQDVLFDDKGVGWGRSHAGCFNLAMILLCDGVGVPESLRRIVSWYSCVLRAVPMVEWTITREQLPEWVELHRPRLLRLRRDIQTGKFPCPN
jgi:hypothetical protein